jgi:hypothetical protein
MKTTSLAIILSTVGLIIFPGCMFSQETIKIENYLESLPKNLELVEETPQKYLMVIDNRNYDFYGNFGSKNRVTGEYTRGLKNGFVKWNNVRIASSQNLDETFAEGVKQIYMENFSYAASEEILNESFFKEIPEADVHIKTIVWNMFTFEIFAWSFWDSLKLNQEYLASEINSVVQIEGLGTIENKDLRFTWTGITNKNGKLCVIIKYIGMNNPLEFDMYNTKIKGSTNYWGNIYVSITDKQIEYGELHEILFMDIKTNGQKPGNKVYSTRKITLEKIR